MAEPRGGRPSGRRQASGSALALVLLAGPWAVPAAGDESARIAAEAASEAAQAAGDISLELIMSDPDWIGQPPEDSYWADGSEAIYFEQKRQGEEQKDLIRIDLASGEQTVVAAQDRGRVDVRGGTLSSDRRLKVYARHGDVFVKDLETGAITQLTRTAEPETDPFFMTSSPRLGAPGKAGRAVAFTRAGQVFVRELETGLEHQPAEVRLEEHPADEEEDDGFLPRQQRRLFDHLRETERETEREREVAESRQSADPSRPPLPFYLGEEIEILQQALSPAGNAILLVVIDKERDDGQKDQMPTWVTDSGYVTTREVRAKVGTGDGRGERLLYLDLATHERHEVDLSMLPGIRDDPLAELKGQARMKGAGIEDMDKNGDGEPPEAGESEPETEPGPRAVRFEEPVVWSPDGTRVAVQAHSHDNKDRWLAWIDAADKTLKTVHRLSHEAWINWHFNDFGWLADSRNLYFLSEASGYSQLYLHSLDDASTRRLTDGDFVVSDLVLDPRERFFTYTANPDHPGIYDTFRVAIDGGRVEQLTDLGGKSASVPSPDGEHLLITHSTTTRPPELYVQPARAGARARRITDTVSEHFASLPWVTPEIVAVPSSHHSRPIYSRYYPPGGTPPVGTPPSGKRSAGDATSAGRPAVIFVHGAGYLQNAHHGWSRYFREFMFHTLLTRHGYAVLDMDYRASAGYGAAWRTAIYRQMGTPELEDLADGVAWLVSEHGVDPGRVGVYGGSYGGFMTFMALFKQPDLFACGAALRPVTDWAHYNHGYTSNILNTPDVDPEAYRRSSPIEFADGLTKPLLICAPMQDDNVFFSDTVRLAQRLIELEKEDWEVAIYPVEPHGFRRPSSWLDEYRRIFKLFETHLKP